MPKLSQNDLSMVRNAVFFPTTQVSNLERALFLQFEEDLKKGGFIYHSIPSLVTKDTIERQGMISWEKVFKIDDNFALAGSAEQGILEQFKGASVYHHRIYAKNQCFRNEPEYEGLKRLREFQKIEQFVFCEDWAVKSNLEIILSTAQQFLTRHNIKYRTVNVTTRDPGYHVLKYDIEILTDTYGWMETHSCSYFGEEQTKRFNITGATHTLSNTGIASPRILVPFLERGQWSIEK